MINQLINKSIKNLKYYIMEIWTNIHISEQNKYSPTSIIRPPFIRISLLSGRDREVIFFFNPMITIGKMM